MIRHRDRRQVKFRLKTSIAALLLAVVVGLAYDAAKSAGGEENIITVSMEPTAVNSLIYIADDRKYFANNGLEVVIEDSYPSGAAAAEQMQRGKSDLSTTAEFAIVRHAFAGLETRVVASIDMFMHMKLIGRKDRGIRTPSDLAGKRIGVPLKTAADFKLGRFLDLHRIDKSKITIVNVQAPQALDALTGAAVDAIVTWQPNVTAITDRLGADAVIWEVQSGQPMYCILATTETWAAKHPDLLRRFLKSLLQAEQYLIANEDGARTIVQKRLGYDDRYIRTIWPEHQFSLRLEQSLILAMEDQARWMIENKLINENKVPDFLEYIHEDGLKEAKPLAVDIIR